MRQLFIPGDFDVSETEAILHQKLEQLGLTDHSSDAEIAKLQSVQGVVGVSRIDDVQKLEERADKLAALQTTEAAGKGTSKRPAAGKKVDKATAIDFAFDSVTPRKPRKPRTKTGQSSSNKPNSSFIVDDEDEYADRYTTAVKIKKIKKAKNDK